MASFTKEQLDALVAAIAEGVLTVRYSDKQVTYRSLDEMLKLKDAMEKDLGLKPKTKKLFTKFSKGLC